MTYDLVVEQAGLQPTHYQLELGSFTRTTTFYPDGTMRPALVRPFHMELVGDPRGTASSDLLFAHCADEAGFCGSALAFDPADMMPFRVFVQEIDLEITSNLVDGSTPSLFWSDDSAPGFWPLSPLLLPQAFAAGEIHNVLGAPVDHIVRSGKDSTHHAFEGEGEWRDSDPAARGHWQIRGEYTLSDALEPTQATLRYRETIEDHNTEIIYTYTRNHAKDVVVLERPQGRSQAPPVEVKECGEDLQDPLLPSSDYEYSASFKVVQEHPSFKAAQASGDAVLMDMQRERKQGSTPGQTTTTWAYNISQGEERVRYVVQRNDLFSPPLPPEETYELVSVTRGETTAFWRILSEGDCVGLDGIAKRIDRFQDAHGASGYLQVYIQSMDIQTFISHGAGERTNPGSYVAVIQPYVEDGQGRHATGPRIGFSLITGDITFIF